MITAGIMTTDNQSGKGNEKITSKTTPIGKGIPKRIIEPNKAIAPNTPRLRKTRNMLATPEPESYPDREQLASLGALAI